MDSAKKSKPFSMRGSLCLRFALGPHVIGGQAQSDG